MRAARVTRLHLAWRSCLGAVGCNALDTRGLGLTILASFKSCQCQQGQQEVPANANQQHRNVYR